MEQSVPINTGFVKFLLSIKILRIRNSHQKQRKKRKTRKRRRIKSEFFFINCIQFIRLKIQKLLIVKIKSQALKKKLRRILPKTSLKPKLTLSAYIAKMYM